MLLTSDQAAIVAHSQKDLGGEDQKQLALVLSDEIDFDSRLDGISAIIANAIGSSDNLDDAWNDLDYTITQLTMAQEAISKLQ
jgi:hypothetical protein